MSTSSRFRIAFATSSALPLAEADFTLTNTQGSATVTLDAGSLAQVHDGTARVVTATTLPAGLSYTVSYDGGAMAPTAVGSCWRGLR